MYSCSIYVCTTVVIRVDFTQSFLSSSHRWDVWDCRDFIGVQTSHHNSLDLMQVVWKTLIINSWKKHTHTNLSQSNSKVLSGQLLNRPLGKTQIHFYSYTIWPSVFFNNYFSFFFFNLYFIFLSLFRHNNTEKYCSQNMLSKKHIYFKNKLQNNVLRICLVMNWLLC